MLTEGCTTPAGDLHEEHLKTIQEFQSRTPSETTLIKKIWLMNNVASSPSVPSACRLSRDRGPLVPYNNSQRVVKAQAMQMDWDAVRNVNDNLCKTAKHYWNIPIDVYYAYKDMVAGRVLQIWDLIY
jgi:hypothetical protein